MTPVLFKAETRIFSIYSGLASDRIGALAECISCEITEERNGIFECEFRYPVNGAMFDKIKPGCIVFATYDVSGTVEPFDIYEFSVDSSGIATFRAQHISYRLNKIVFAPGVECRGYLYGGYPNDITRKLTTNSSIQLNMLPYIPGSTVPYSVIATGFTPENDQTLYWIDTKKSKSIRDALIGGSNSIVSQGSAEMKWNMQSQMLVCTIMYRRGADTTAVIRLGDGLTDYRYEYDESDYSEEIIPYWVNSDGTALLLDQLHNDQGLYVDYISVPGQKQRGERFTATLIEFTDKVEGDEEPSSEALEKYAREYYDAHNLKSGYESLSITYDPLWQTEDYEDRIDPAQRLKLCDTAQVWIPEIGVNKRMKLVRTVWDVLRERYTKLDFGRLERNLFNYVDGGGTQEQDDSDATIIDGGEVGMVGETE